MIPKVGQEFSRAARFFRDGSPVVSERVAVVLETGVTFRNVWTDRTVTNGIRFEMTDIESGRRSYHVLSLDEFRNAWMN